MALDDREELQIRERDPLILIDAGIENRICRLIEEGSYTQNMLVCIHACDGIMLKEDIRRRYRTLVQPVDDVFYI